MDEPHAGFPRAGPKEGKEVSPTRWVAGSPLDAGRDAFAPLSNRLTGRPVTVQLRETYRYHEKGQHRPWIQNEAIGFDPPPRPKPTHKHPFTSLSPAQEHIRMRGPL